MKWRKWIRLIHRDLGYICTGLTVIYAISGIAVNHVADWNPNYKIERISSKIEPVLDSIANPEAIAKEILAKIGEKGEYKNTFLPDPHTMQIFAEGNTIKVDLPTGKVEQEKIVSRAFLRESNFLHLNSPKKAWTYVADIFAFSLAFLAISGLFMIKGKNGITGRGAWLTALGILLPIIFLLLYF